LVESTSFQGGLHIDLQLQRWRQTLMTVEDKGMDLILQGDSRREEEQRSNSKP
jgi:hypothetical protein